MKQRIPNYQDKTFDVIAALQKDVFTMADIRPHFPERPDNNISATLCALAANDLIYRTGKRITLNQGKKKGHYVEYTTNKALAAAGGDATAMRGWDPKDIRSVSQDDEIKRLTNNIKCLTDKLNKARAENKKLRHVLSLIDPVKLVDLMLEVNGS